MRGASPTRLEALRVRGAQHTRRRGAGEASHGALLFHSRHSAHGHKLHLLHGCSHTFANGAATAAAEVVNDWLEGARRLSGRDVGAAFGCSELFSIGAGDNLCHWVDDRTLRADAAGVVPGDTITALLGVLRAACVAGDRCECYGANTAGFVAVESPAKPVVPEALLAGPSTAAVCEGLVLTSDQSTGGGGRAFDGLHAGDHVKHALLPRRHSRLLLGLCLLCLDLSQVAVVGRARGCLRSPARGAGPGLRPLRPLGR